MPPFFVLRILSVLGAVGITRWSSAAVRSPLMGSDYLDDQEKQIYTGFVHRRLLTTNMLEETRLALVNARVVERGGVPVAAPMYFFISDGREIAVDRWRELLAGYTKQLENGQYMFLDTGHYIHHHEPLAMVEQINVFLSAI